MSHRRNFLKRWIGVLFGSVLGLIALPQLETGTTPEVSAMGDKQLRLLLASKALLEKVGMLRASSIFHNAPGGEIEMDWSVLIPPENSITSNIDSLARQVLALVNG